MEYILTEHAETTVREREIKREWINRALDAPDLLRPHEEDSSLRYAFKRIEEQGNRVLRVIYNAEKNPVHVVTVYFDRTMKGKL